MASAYCVSRSDEATAGSRKMPCGPRTLDPLHQLGGDEQQAQGGARQQAADEDGARQAEGRLGLAAQLHQGAVADAALQRVQRVQPLPPLPQRRQVLVLYPSSTLAQARVLDLRILSGFSA